MRVEWGLAAIIPFLILVHAMPHLPGDPVEPAGAYVGLADRAISAVPGEQYPYPIHADEYQHLAWMSQVIRQGTADIDDPYVGGKETQDLFTVQGMRSERGWNVAIAQLSLLTDVSLLTMARFLPALWAGFLGLTIWAALRPAPGALAAAAMVAILPTTVRFLGIGFLVPSSFALPWVVVTLIVATRVNGAPRFFGLLLLITAAHFMHLVLGVSSILAAIAGTLVRGETLGRRAAMLLAALIPLVWILPASWLDAKDAVGSEHTLPFEQEVFLTGGAILYILAGLGVIFAFIRPDENNRPHRALALMAIPLTLSLFISVINEHRNDATYSRILFVFFLCFIGLASYGIAQGIRYVQDQAPWRPARSPWITYGAVAVAVLFLLPAPLATNMDAPYYRYVDDEAWAAAKELERLDVGVDDILLSEPAHGPMYNAITGARLAVPFTPSGLAANDAWEYYVESGGADPEWLKERGITIIVGMAPNATYTEIGRGIYAVT